MRLFLDCEYNSFGGELISLALVSEDGREFYEVVPCAKPHPWVRKNVMPLLGKKPVSKNMLRYRLRKWLEQFDEIHVIADWPEDVAHFCGVIVDGPGSRINTPPLTMEILKIDAGSTLPHNALHDARGIRDAVLSRGT